MEQVGLAAPGRGSERPGPLARGSLKADLERWPSLSSCATCLASETLEVVVGLGGCNRGQALGQLPSQACTLAPSTHLVWAGMGHTRSPPKRPPHCHSSPLGQSAPTGGWHTGKKATDMCYHFSPPLLCTEMSQESPGQSSLPPTLCQRIPPPKGG